MCSILLVRETHLEYPLRARNGPLPHLVEKAAVESKRLKSGDVSVTGNRLCTGLSTGIGDRGIHSETHRTSDSGGPARFRWH